MEKRDFKIIKKGRVHGFKYYIVEHHLYTVGFKWYCCYVGIPDFIKSQVDPDECEVHGGITFKGYHDRIAFGTRFLWGWDYNHFDDMVLDDCFKTKLQILDEETRLNILYGDVVKFIERNLL